ncbi:MAG TPA: DinB family protein [Vicinamibacterales bacterium]
MRRAVVELLTGSIENESKATRKVIAAIPNGNRDYKPDPKSRSAWDIAVHLALSDIWFADSILSGTFVWAGEPPTPKEMTDPAAVARWHEQHLGARLAKLRAMTPDQMVRIVDAFGMSAPAAGWLTMMNNHAIHHRGQLAAYLRPAGSKVPAIYGVSADESAFA